MQNPLKSFIKKHRIMPLINTLLITLLIVLLLPALYYLSEIVPVVIIIITAITIGTMFAFSIYTLINGIRHYKTRSATLSGLIILYIELMMFYATIYFVLNLIAPTSFSGIEQLTFAKSTSLTWSYLLHSAQVYADALHFSIVTGTTLGYGDIVPKTTTARLLSDTQVLLSLGLAVAGFGAYFARKTNHSL